MLVMEQKQAAPFLYSTMSLEIEQGYVEVRYLGFYFKMKTTGLHLLPNFPDS